MPLYTACPCRLSGNKDATPYMAQMMRVYVVTPASIIKTDETSIDYKSSLISCSPPSNRTLSQQLNENNSNSILQIALRPRVQPNPLPCPTFWPSHNQSAIYLAENSIWVLRLP